MCMHCFRDFKRKGDLGPHLRAAKNGQRAQDCVLRGEEYAKSGAGKRIKLADAFGRHFPESKQLLDKLDGMNLPAQFYAVPESIELKDGKECLPLAALKRTLLESAGD